MTPERRRKKVSDVRDRLPIPNDKRLVRTIEPGGVPRDVAERLGRGEVAICRETLQTVGLRDTVRDPLIAAIERTVGRDAARPVGRDGLTSLHRVADRAGIAKIHRRAERHLRRHSLDLARRIADVLFDDRPLLLCRFAWLRIVTPSRHDDSSHGRKPGRVGRLRETPPHRDTWASLPRNTLNIWLALTEVSAEQTVLIYPDRWHRPVDRQTRHDLVSGQDFGAPIVPTLADGDSLLFSADHLHSSAINTTDRTRIAVTFRVAPGPLRYNDEGFQWVPFVDRRHVGTVRENLAVLKACRHDAFRRWLGRQPKLVRRRAKRRLRGAARDALASISRFAARLSAIR